MNFFSYNIWRKLFFLKKNKILKLNERFLYDRSSIIPKNFNRFTINIYSGKIWQKKKINKWRVGYRFGEFTWNRKLALYKLKQKKKK